MFDQWKSVQHKTLRIAPADAEDVYVRQVNQTLEILQESQREKAETFFEVLCAIYDPRNLETLERSLLRESPALMRNPEARGNNRMDISMAKVTLFAARRALLISLFGQN